ncbi:XRE family transcriptional regulator [Rhodococcus sp. CUA-806]|nr:XRE family transcriptional regulator [Rhodococcus sp. CUA-806]
MSRSGVRHFSGARLRRLRERRGWSVDDLAGKAGVSRQAISTWETSKALPTPALLKKIASALQVAIEDLVLIPSSDIQIGDLRVRAGLTQAEAAAGLSVSATLIVDIERGRKPVNEDRLQAFAQLYGVESEEIREAWQRAIAARMARLKSLE